MKILIAIPCYRCAKQIPRVLEKLGNASFLNKIEHIVLIDNRSPDNTIQKAQQTLQSLDTLKNKAAIYQNEENYGLGGTHKVAFDLGLKMKMDYIFILHGDDQAEVDDIGRLILKLEEDTSIDAILGSRFSAGSRLVGYQKKRIFGNLVLNAIYTILTSKKTNDLGSGLNLYSLKTLAKIPYHDLSSQFNFNAELLLSLYDFNAAIAFFPIEWREEDQESNAGNISVAIKMLKSLFYWKFKKLKKEKARTYNSLKLEN